MLWRMIDNLYILYNSSTSDMIFTLDYKTFASYLIM